MKIAHLCLAALAVLTWSIDAAAQTWRPDDDSQIEWRAHNRYRLFGRQSDELMRRIYDLPQRGDWVSANWRRFAEVTREAMFAHVNEDRRDCARDVNRCAHSNERSRYENLRLAYDEARNARFLFELDRANYASDTSRLRYAWDRARHEYDPHYVTPAAYPIRANLRQRIDGKICVWTIESDGFDPEPPISRDCDAANVELIVRARWPSRRATEGAATHRARIVVEVRDRPDGPSLLELRRDVEVRDVLIVGMGDSFASGEGSPDVPANWSGLSQAAVDSDPTLAADLDRVAGPSGAGWIASVAASSRVAGAIWLDQQCHRSLLSWQAISSMALAARSDDTFVTFMSFACGGGSTIDGLILPQRGPPGGLVFEYGDNSQQAPTLYCSNPGYGRRDELFEHYRDLTCPAGAERVTHRSQIDQLLSALCGGAERQPTNSFIAYFNMERGDRDNLAPTPVRGVRCTSGATRNVDHLLVTLGGNDIGFAEAIMWTMLPSEAEDNSAIRRWIVRELNDVFERAKCPYSVEADAARCATWLVADEVNGYRVRENRQSRCRNARAIDELRGSNRQPPHAHYLITCYLELTLPAFRAELRRSGVGFGNVLWSAYPNPTWRRADTSEPPRRPGDASTTRNHRDDEYLCGIPNDDSGDMDYFALPSAQGLVSLTGIADGAGRLLGPFSGYSRLSARSDYGFRIRRSEMFEASQELVDPLNDSVRRLASGDDLPGRVIDDYLGPLQGDDFYAGRTDHVLDSPADARGWCAINSEDADPSNDHAPFGDLSFPMYIPGQGWRARDSGGDGAEPLGPDRWDPNAGHARLFRTPNDALLTQFAAPPPRARWFAQLGANAYQLRNGAGGMMHPGAEFHAIVASATLLHLNATDTPAVQAQERGAEME